MKTLLVLTQYKRNNLKKQLDSVKNQSLKPDYVVVFQNENHKDISELKKEYEFIHMKSDYNTKYFGRFAACFTYPVDMCIIMDDDIIPGNKCFENYIDECIKLNGIIGGNGRIGYNNKNILKRPGDTGNRPESTLVDFVGHLWCFKKEWLHYMFSIKPYTYDTGEDMHFCYSSKILGNISSYVGKQIGNGLSDTTNNRLAADEFASFKTTSSDLRKSVENYFIKNFDLKLIENN